MVLCVAKSRGTLQMFLPTHCRVSNGSPVGSCKVFASPTTACRSQGR